MHKRARYGHFGKKQRALSLQASGGGGGGGGGGVGHACQR